MSTLNLIYKFYKKFIKAKIHKASSIVAEAAKIIENTQRDINIALINEFFKICDALNVDIYDVLNGKYKMEFYAILPRSCRRTLYKCRSILFNIFSKKT